MEKETKIDEKIQEVAKQILIEHSEAFKELAKW